MKNLCLKAPHHRNNPCHHALFLLASLIKQSDIRDNFQRISVFKYCLNTHLVGF